MSRQPLNEAFAHTSFLNGVNAAYIEEMQAVYERNPGSVSDEWRLFFESLHEEQGQGAVQPAAGASWAVPLERLQNGHTSNDVMSALTGDYSQAEQYIQGQIQTRAVQGGVDLSMAASLRATQDSIRALMLIRAYRVMGHLAANLDPLELSEPTVHNELRPDTYGFTEADFDRPIFIDYVLGLETATIRQIMRILRRTYCQHIGYEFMHITTPAQKSWIQQRIEGEEKDISFTVEGKKAILNKLIEAETYEKFCEVKYTGTKRFGLEGGESMVPALDKLSSAAVSSASRKSSLVWRIVGASTFLPMLWANRTERFSTSSRADRSSRTTSKVPVTSSIISEHHLIDHSTATTSTCL